MKAEREFEMLNYSAWLYGSYNLEAISAALVKDNKYPEKPREKKKEKVSPTKAAAQSFEAWAIKFNINREKELGESNGSRPPGNSS